MKTSTKIWLAVAGILTRFEEKVDGFRREIGIDEQ